MTSPAKNKPASHPFWQADKPYLHDHTITDARFRRLGYMMAASAGAINAGGFFAVSHYTSHVSGALSHASDRLVAQDWINVLTAMSGVWCFILGATFASFTILWGKRRRFRSCYGLAMWWEAVFLLIFALSGSLLSTTGMTATLMLLCFIMGMHNTVTSMLSGGVIRSTHMTGTATDLGIELSHLLYHNRKKHHSKLPEIQVNRAKMWLLLGLINNFILGGIIGVYGYNKIGYLFTIPVAAMLFLFGSGSIGYDIKIRFKWWLIKKIREREKAKHQTFK